MKTSKQKTLLAYSGMAAAFVSIATNVEGQVFYTDLDPDVQVTSFSVPGGSMGFYDIDLNEDGIDDFRIYKSNSSSSYGGQKKKGILALGAGQIATTSLGIYGSPPPDPYANPLNLSETVSSGLNWDNGPAIFYSRSYGFATSNLWPGWQGMGQQAAGIRMQIDGQTHYGWIRLTVQSGFMDLVIDDFMLNANPNEALPIDAEPCQKPHGLNPTAISSTSVQFSWNEVHDAGIYKLRGRVNGGPVRKVSTSNNSITISGISAGASIEWQVRAVCNDGSVTPYSDVSTITLPALKGESPELLSQVKLVNRSLQLSGDDSPFRVKIYDLTGRLCYEAIGRQHTLNHLPAAIYVAEISQGNSIFSEKILLE